MSLQRDQRDAEVSLDNYATGFFASSDCPARLCVDVASGCGRDIILKVCAQTDVKVAQYEHDGDVLMWSDRSMPLIHSSRPLLHVSTTAPDLQKPSLHRPILFDNHLVARDGWLNLPPIRTGL